MITLAITNYNRFEMLLESFAQVKDDERISEILILDDASTDNCYEKLCEVLKGEPKIRLLRNPQNLGMGRSKYEAIKAASNETVCILDSDNILYPQYLDAFFKIETIHEHLIYCAEFAMPKFDFREFSGTVICRDNIKHILSKSMGEVLLNCCNYIVNRDWYTHVYEPSSYHNATDTFWFNTRHLKKDGRFYVVPEMEYFHRIHESSGFIQDVHNNMRKAKELKQEVMSW